MKAPRDQTRPRRRLFWRIYLNGILLLVLVAAAVGGVILVSGETLPWRGASRRLADLLATEVALDTSRLQSRLDEYSGLLQIELAVFGPEGTLLAAAGEGTLSPLSQDEVAGLGASSFHGHDHRLVRFALPLKRDDASAGYLLMGWEKAHGPTRLLSVMLAVLAALALASIPLARAIARPLERLTATARDLAAGDLAARTGMVRKDEVGVLARAMDHMAAQLEHRLKRERELLANISHEIRTPLARIRVALELCEEEQDSVEAIRAHLSEIGGDVAELDALVQNVLMTARLDLAASGDDPAGLAPRLEQLELAGLIAQAAERFARHHPGRELQARVPADLPSVQADPALLHRVLDNLLDNAVKYSPADRPVEIEARSNDLGIEVEVRDRGIGVSEQEAERLFEPFFRTERGRSSLASGTGLGLTLCKRIVEAHGGTIEAAPRPGGGTRVLFVLPLQGVLQTGSDCTMISNGTGRRK